LLSKDCYLLEGLQSADKTKTPKSKVTKCTHFYRKGSYSNVMYIDAYINFMSVTCSPHSAKTTIG